MWIGHSQEATRREERCTLDRAARESTVRDAAFPTGTIDIVQLVLLPLVFDRRRHSPPAGGKRSLYQKPPNMFLSLPAMTLPVSLEVTSGLRPRVCLLSVCFSVFRAWQ